MKLILILCLLQITLLSNEITCRDVIGLEDNSDKKIALHIFAQKIAQEKAENFIDKKMKYPYGFSGELEKTEMTLKQLIPFIEMYWCSTPNKPLHSAYYDLYMSNKVFWTGKYF